MTRIRLELGGVGFGVLDVSDVSTGCEGIVLFGFAQGRMIRKTIVSGRGAVASELLLFSASLEVERRLT